MRKTIWAAAIGAVVVGGCAFAMANQAEPELDTPSVKERIGELADANTPAAKAEARFEAKLAAQTARELDVGDPDSFGRPVRWMGLMSGQLLVMRQDCAMDPGEAPSSLCLETSTTDTATRVGEYRDIARITLPARSTETLLCHWLTPTIIGSFVNNTGAPYANGRISAQPSLTIESEVLNAPGLVDPDSGEPLNGKMEIYGSSAVVYGSAAPGQVVQNRHTSTRTCIAGYVNKRSLIEVYGLSERQAKQFFNKPITLRMNMLVFASMVRDGNVAFAFRFVGD